jgi:signal-transduction protein with cAMP-binding, CBS, and nucleotidyltransferase domain
MRFYCDFLNKFEPMSIKGMTVFSRQDTAASEVFFLLKGCVECVSQNKYYLEGTVFGETDIVMNRLRNDTYMARGDCYILKLDKQVFHQIMDEFPEFKDDIDKIVAEREKKRLETQQQAKLKRDVQEEFKELN